MTTLATGPATVATAPLTTAQKMKQIVLELQHELIERSDHVYAAVIAMMARTNGIGYGDPGTGKSLLFDLLARRINGKYVRILMDRQMDKSEVIGMFDLPHYEQTGEYTRNTKDTLLDAVVAVLEEVGKTGQAATTPTLMALNEHKGKPGGQEIDIPLLVAFGTSNEELEAGQEAFGDRFVVKLVFDRIQTVEGMLALFDSAITPRRVKVPTTVSAEDVMFSVEHEVPAVAVPQGVRDELIALRAELQAEQIFPSDRTWFIVIRLLQACAWLESRDAVIEDDIAFLRHVLWSNQEQRQKVGRIVMKHTGPVTRLAITLLTSVTEAEAQIDDLVARSESVETKASTGGKLQHDISQMRKKIDKARAECVAKGRSTAQLDEVEERIKELHLRVYVDCMSTPEKGARRLVYG